MTDKLEIEDYILDVETTDSGFTVIMELPGELYDQDYPKRLRHGFPNEKRWFKKEEEIFKWKRHLQKKYLESSEKEMSKKELNERVNSLKQNLKRES